MKLFIFATLVCCLLCNKVSVDATNAMAELINDLLCGKWNEFLSKLSCIKKELQPSDFAVFQNVIEYDSIEYEQLLDVIGDEMNFTQFIRMKFEEGSSEWINRAVEYIFIDHSCRLDELLHAFLCENLKVFRFLMERKGCNLALCIDDEFLEKLISNVQSKESAEIVLYLFHAYPAWIPFYSTEILYVIGSFGLGSYRIDSFLKHYSLFDENLLVQVLVEKLQTAEIHPIALYISKIVKHDCSGFYCLTKELLQAFKKLALESNSYDWFDLIPPDLYGEFIAESLIIHCLSNKLLSKFHLINSMYSIKVDFNRVDFKSYRMDEIIELFNAYPNIDPSFSRILTKMMRNDKLNNLECLKVCNCFHVIHRQVFKGFLLHLLSNFHLIYFPADISHIWNSLSVADYEAILHVVMKYLKFHENSSIPIDLFFLFSRCAIKLGFVDEEAWNLYERVSKTSFLSRTKCNYYLRYYGNHDFKSLLLILTDNFSRDEARAMLMNTSFPSELDSDMLALLTNFLDKKEFFQLYRNVVKKNDFHSLTLGIMESCLSLAFKKSCVEMILFCNPLEIDLPIEFLNNKRNEFGAIDLSHFSTLESWKFLCFNWQSYPASLIESVISSESFINYMLIIEMPDYFEQFLLDFLPLTSDHSFEAIFYLFEKKNFTTFAVSLLESSHAASLVEKLMKKNLFSSFFYSSLHYIYNRPQLAHCKRLLDLIGQELIVDTYLFHQNYSDSSIIEAAAYLIEANYNIFLPYWINYLPKALIFSKEDLLVLSIISSSMYSHIIHPMQKYLMISFCYNQLQATLNYCLSNWDVQLPNSITNVLHLLSEENQIKVLKSVDIWTIDNIQRFFTSKNINLLKRPVFLTSCVLWEYLVLESNIDKVEIIASHSDLKRELFNPRHCSELHSKKDFVESFKKLVKSCFMKNKLILYQMLLNWAPREKYQSLFTSASFKLPSFTLPFYSADMNHKVPARFALGDIHVHVSAKRRFNLFLRINRPFANQNTLWLEDKQINEGLWNWNENNWILRSSRIKIEYLDLGSKSVDATGLLRSWLQKWTKILTAELFEFNELGKLIPRRNLNSERLSKLGKIIGISLLSHNFLYLPFSRFVFKLLLGIPFKCKDLKQVDPSLFQSLYGSSLEGNYIEFSKITFKDKVYKLSDENVFVDSKNQREYRKLVASAILTDYKKSLKPMIDGFKSLISSNSLRLLHSWKELKKLICGRSSRFIDMLDWKLNSNFNGSQEFKHWFWNVVESFNEEEKGDLIEFVHGSRVIPTEGFKGLLGASGKNLFTVTVDCEKDIENLPTSLTCFNLLIVPNYDSEDTLKKKLLMAITHSKEFTEK